MVLLSIRKIVLILRSRHLQGQHRQALEELQLAEEAFELCRSDIVEAIDNVGLLLLDLVWCAAAISCC